jgi:hypothetical protein
MPPWYQQKKNRKVPVEIIDTSCHIFTGLDPMVFGIPAMSCCNSSEFASALAFKLHQHQGDENAMILMLEFAKNLWIRLCHPTCHPADGAHFVHSSHFVAKAPDFCLHCV